MTTLVIDDKCDNKNTMKCLQVHIYNTIPKLKDTDEARSAQKSMMKRMHIIKTFPKIKTK